MEKLPFYIALVFILTTALTFYFLYRATNSKKILLIVLAWIIVQSVISLTGFYTISSSAPPRFILLLLPPVITIVILFILPKGRQLIDRFDVKRLTWLHIVRIPVEIGLLLLFIHKQVPGLMTFEGRNFDILSGLTAPVIAWFGYTKLKLNKSILLIWNFICLGLLLNIVVNAVLSAPFPFQQFGFDQPNVAILHFPFILLPGFIVPVVLLAHLVCIRRLLK